MTDDVRYSFTQPLCDPCWDGEHTGREPIRLRDTDPEMCCKCGEPTLSGIYIRVNPHTVKYPTITKD